MKYNLTINSQVESNTDIGNVDLNSNEILPIIRTTTATDVVLADGDILVLDCDLGAQIKIDEIRYYFSTTAASGTVASGIEFFYKYEDFESYISLSSYVGPGYYYTTITSGTSAPRYIRVQQTLTGISGTVAGFEVINNDEIVDFGEDSTDTFTNLELSLRYDTEDINPVYIFNSGAVKATAHIILEPQGTVADDVLTVSVNSTGPWYGPKQTDNEVLGPTTWDYGVMDNTEVTLNQLRISSGNHFGTFTSKVFDTFDTQKFTYLNLDVTYPTTSGIVAVDDTDTSETLEIKSSNKAPIDYLVYRKLKVQSGLRYIDYWLYDDSIKFTSSNIAHPSTGVGGDSSTFDHRAKIYIDTNNRKSFILCIYDDTNANIGTKVELMRTSFEGTAEDYYILASSSTSQSTTNMQVYSLLGDANGGVWFYMYWGNNAFGWFDDTNSYYLAYFDYNIDEQFKQVDSDSFVYDMSIVYSTGELWYSDSQNNSAVKLDTDGTIIASMDLTSDVRGIIAEIDGSCWIVQGTKISHIDSDGEEVLSEIDLSATAINLSRVALDGDSALWITDGHYIRRVLKTGSVDFSLEMPTQPIELKAYETGVAVLCVDRSWNFISRGDKRIINTLENTSSINIDVGIEGIEYTNLVYSSEFPVPADNQWTALEWKKVFLDYYNLSENRYHQIKLTLRDDGNYVSPIVNGLYLNESIAIENILPNQYGTIYLRANITGQTESGNYPSNLKTWWYLTN